MSFCFTAFTSQLQVLIPHLAHFKYFQANLLPFGFGSSPSYTGCPVTYLEFNPDQVSIPDQLAWMVPQGLECKLKALCDSALTTPASFTACWPHALFQYY